MMNQHAVSMEGVSGSDRTEYVRFVIAVNHSIEDGGLPEEIRPIPIHIPAHIEGVTP